MENTSNNINKPKREALSINLPQEQAFKIHYLIGRESFIKANYRFDTKTPWECLRCGDLIFTGYNVQGRKSVFCEKHEAQNKRPTIVQLQYIKRMKETQLKVLKEVDESYVQFLDGINGLAMFNYEVTEL